MISNLRRCPLCNNNASEIIEKGTILRYPNKTFSHFHCTSYYIHCKACGYSVEKENLIDAKLSWNMDTPTISDLEWYINHGRYMQKEWENVQNWLPASVCSGKRKAGEVG